MDLNQFLALQEELFWAFGWHIRWWLILFAFAGVLTAMMLFILSIVSAWLERFNQ
jgi:hypothetical protein